MSELRTHTRLWFALAAALFVFGAVALHDTAQAMVEVAAAAVFLGAAIRSVGLAVRDDPTGARVLSRSGLMGGVLGGLASMTAREGRRRPRGDRGDD
jgi:hypothetical protein